MARTRGNDSLASSKHQRGRRRRLVHVFTERRVTEPSYIEIIRDRGVPADTKVTVEVRIANATAPDSRRTPTKLVEAAVALMRDEVRDAERSGLAREFWPQVWCVFDRDQHESIETAFGGVCGLVASRLPLAQRRALQMNAVHDDRVPMTQRDPYTDMFAFVEDGLGITSY